MLHIIQELPEIERQKIQAIQPAWVNPMLATLTEERFSSPDWLFEPKFDGERCLAFKQGRTIKLFSRNRKNLNNSYPEIAAALDRQMPDCILDGEVVAFEGSVTSFAKLQRRMHTIDPAEARRSAVKVYYYIFDLLFLDGYDIRNAALLERQKLLKQAVNFRDPLRFTTHRAESGELFYKKACRQGWEGLIAKRAASSYVSGRSRDWLKFKCVVGQEFVIGGYTDPQGARTGFGALLVGYYKGKKLQYTGKVGTGFDERALGELKMTLSKLEKDQSPFETQIKEKSVHWVKPSLVAQVGFSQWTAQGKLRHPRFQGLRRDKKAQEVVRE